MEIGQFLAEIWPKTSRNPEGLGSKGGRGAPLLENLRYTFLKVSVGFVKVLAHGQSLFVKHSKCTGLSILSNVFDKTVESVFLKDIWCTIYTIKYVWWPHALGVWLCGSTLYKNISNKNLGAPIELQFSLSENVLSTFLGWYGLPGISLLFFKTSWSNHWLGLLLGCLNYIANQNTHVISRLK